MRVYNRGPRARAPQEMSEIVGVYECWKKIVKNLVNPLLTVTHADCRWWSINYFYHTLHVIGNFVSTSSKYMQIIIKSTCYNLIKSAVIY